MWAKQPVLKGISTWGGVKKELRSTGVAAGKRLFGYAGCVIRTALFSGVLQFVSFAQKREKMGEKKTPPNSGYGAPHRNQLGKNQIFSA